MDTNSQPTPVDKWLRDLGFLNDPYLGQVRNPFAYLEGETDPALEECFIPPFPLDFVASLDSAPHLIVVGAPGSGKSALLTWWAKQQASVPIGYSSLTGSAIYVLSKPTNPIEILVDIKNSNQIDIVTVARLLIHFIDNDQARSPDVRFRICLPSAFKKAAAPYSFNEIAWSPTNLAELLRLRLRWASDGQFQDLAQLCDHNLRSIDPHTKLASMAKTPQRLFQLGQQLLGSHTKSERGSASSIQLCNEDWQTLQAYADENPYVEPTILPAPAINIEQPTDLILNLSFVDEDRSLTGKQADHLLEMLEGISIDGFIPGKQIKDFGSALFDYLLLDKKYQKYNELDNHRLTKGKMGAPIRLHLTLPKDSPRLFNIPWELLYDQDRFVVKEGVFEIIRHLDLQQPCRDPVSVDGPLRVLYVSPRPTDQEVFPCYDEEALEAVKSQQVDTQNGRIPRLEVIKVTPPTYERFRDCITSSRRTIHVVHFDGHGAFGYLCPSCDKVNPSPVCGKCHRDLTNIQPQGFLFFERREDYKSPSTHRVPTTVIANLLARSTIPLVVLNACRSSQVGNTYTYSGLATRLILAGISGVIGILSDIAAPVTRDFVQGFYEALAPMEGMTLVDAVARGRWLLSTATYSANQFTQEWWHLPVLYLRSTDGEGRLFELNF